MAGSTTSHSIHTHYDHCQRHDFQCTTTLLTHPDTASCHAAMTVIFAFYSSVSVTGYLALGNDVPDDVLTGFSTSPKWVQILANCMVVVHMISGVQLFAHGFYKYFEDATGMTAAAVKGYRKRLATARAIYRTLYVLGITVVAVILPFFSAIVGEHPSS